jgi:hypothetical protein
MGFYKTSVTEITLAVPGQNNTENVEALFVNNTFM